MTFTEANTVNVFIRDRLSRLVAQTNARRTALS